MSRPARRRAVLAAGVATLFGGSVALVPATAPPTRHTLTGSTRTQVALNGGWRFLRADAPGAQAVGFDDSAWTPVTVPHTWNACDGQDGGDDYYRGAGWYRRRYTPPAGWAGKRLWLQFDGANTVTDVWVNGRHLGRHRGGYAGPHRRDGRRPQQRHPAARRDGVHRRG